jgi:CysZ protein
MIINAVKGFGFIFKGITLLPQKGIRLFVLIPLLINSLVFSLAIWLSSKQIDRWIDYILPDWLIWLEWLLWPIFALIFFLVIFYSFTIVANLIAAPFNALLAERVEAKLKGLPPAPFEGYKSIPRLLLRTFKSEAQKLLYMAKWFIVLIILTLIPVVNIISPLAWLVFGAWMLAIEYTDYPMGNHNLFFDDELKTLKNHKGLAFGFGSGVALLTSIPFINFLAMPIGVAAGTALWVKYFSADYQI